MLGTWQAHEALLADPECILAGGVVRQGYHAGYHGGLGFEDNGCLVGGASRVAVARRPILTADLSNLRVEIQAANRETIYLSQSRLNVALTEPGADRRCDRTLLCPIEFLDRVLLFVDFHERGLLLRSS
jgi:hypothetical protein